MTGPVEDATGPRPTCAPTASRRIVPTTSGSSIRQPANAAIGPGADTGCVLCRHFADAGPATTFAAVADLPVALEVPAAGRLLGIGRTRAYQMARDDTFPTRVIPIGRGYLVPTADLLRLLGIRLEPENTEEGGEENPERVDNSTSINSSLTSWRPQSVH